MFFKTFRRFKHLSASSKESFYLTTPIFYVNAAPHIGHLYSAVIADAIARYQSLTNLEQTVHLTTGTDEHGTKVQQAARSRKLPPADYCDQISAAYKTLFVAADINFTDFVRTTELRHKQAVACFWDELKSRGHIQLSQHQGWYCTSDETFLTDSQLHTNSDGSKISLESGHPAEWTEETNYVFKLSKLQDDVRHWVKSTSPIRPAIFEKILLDYLNEQLPDISISRPSNRVHWAIRTPDDDSQTVYVWLDALVNYLTSAGYPNEKFRRLWPPNLHVIGKDILKFHGIYWPAFLIGAGLEPPQRLFVHSHWTVDGQKMSKSKFNVVDPIEVSKLYTMEGLRYFLLREGVPHNDGNYSNTKVLRILNSELADTLGNLLSRCCGKSLNPRQVYPQKCPHQTEQILTLDAGKRLQETLYHLPARCKRSYEDNNFYMVVDAVMATLHAANNFFESLKPWELKGTSTTDFELLKTQHERLNTIISMTMDTVRFSGIILQPIIPKISAKLLDKLCVPPAERMWHNLKEPFVFDVKSNRDQDVPLTDVDAILFRRIMADDGGDRKIQPQQRGERKKRKAS